jgi:hypothetical protein
VTQENVLDKDEKIQICNYAVAFIDLLGQRAAMPDRYLPPNQSEAIRRIKESVGKITATQKGFENFYNSYAKSQSLFSVLPAEVQQLNPDMAPGQLKWQYFSDGLVVYVPLGEGLVQSPINGIYAMLLAAGMLCCIGLAAGAPIRAGIDVAWAVEYRTNELYGSAIAHAYELESNVAKWPRVVVGQGLSDYLTHCASELPTDTSSQYRQQMSLKCQQLICADSDGIEIVDYLGSAYGEVSKSSLDSEVQGKALAFIDAQIAKWSAIGDAKLQERYRKLKAYFDLRLA